jgi:SAM-dependent methyltransferase
VPAVLELGVGAGRVASALAADGVHVVGVERDACAIALGRRAHPSPRIEWVQGDMRGVDLERQFDRVILPYNGLFTLATDDDVRACFLTAARHLSPNGYFVFDFWVADPFHAEEADDHDGDSGDGGQGHDEEDEPVATIRYAGTEYDVFESTRWSRAAQRVDATYRYVPRGGGAELRSDVMSRYLLCAQIEPLLRAAGLELVVRHGDFDQSAWDEDCERMIVTAQHAPPDERT